MKRLLIVVCGLALLMTPNVAAAYMITFDELAPGANIHGVNLGGVTLYSEDGIVTVVNDYGVGWRSPFNAVTNERFLTFYSMTLVFDVLQDSITVTGGDRGGDTDQFTVSAFDAFDNLLGVVTTPIFGGNALDPAIMVDYFTVDLSFTGMKKVVVSDAINAGIGLDNITFCNQVPVPAALWLLGSGLLGLIGLRRKFRA